jgi:hypothetical protein
MCDTTDAAQLIAVWKERHGRKVIKGASIGFGGGPALVKSRDDALRGWR